MASFRLKKTVPVSRIKTLLDSLPYKFSLAFSYGSALPQNNQNQPIVVSYILSVDDPEHWHRENLRMNPDHYSFLRSLGAGLIAYMQDKFGAGLYYNPLVNVNGYKVNYGVISTANLLRDLQNWDTLHVSGFLHKPVVWLQEPTELYIQRAVNFNLGSALRVALLSLPEIFTDEELFLKIAAISYTRDSKMGLAEDSHTVRNIVHPQFDSFWKLYEPYIKSMNIHWNPRTSIMEQDISPSARIQHLSELPKRVRHQLLMLYSKDGHYLDVEDVLITVAHDSDCGELITEAIAEIVKETKWKQNFKGILTAGFTKSFKYFMGKLKKKYRPINNKSVNI